MPRIVAASTSSVRSTAKASAAIRDRSEASFFDLSRSNSSNGMDISFPSGSSIREGGLPFLGGRMLPLPRSQSVPSCTNSSQTSGIGESMSAVGANLLTKLEAKSHSSSIRKLGNIEKYGELRCRVRRNTNTTGRGDSPRNGDDGRK